jgi:hypothetical protein
VYFRENRCVFLRESLCIFYGYYTNSV